MSFLKISLLYLGYIILMYYINGDIHRYLKD